MLPVNKRVATESPKQEPGIEELFKKKGAEDGARNDVVAAPVNNDLDYVVDYTQAKIRYGGKDIPLPSNLAINNSKLDVESIRQWSSNPGTTFDPNSADQLSESLIGF